MSTLRRPIAAPAEPDRLENGDHMTREEFHRIYEQMPEDFRAELIGGIVFVASPLRRRHSNAHVLPMVLFGIYEGDTPGTEVGDNPTVILGDEAEPQPDLLLRILPEYGGQSRTTSKDYIEGPPELVAEISDSTRSVDLHAKRRDYQRYGVLEYLVFSLREKQIHWFDLRAGHELRPDDDGVLRIRTFPGLWLDHDAVMAKQTRRATRVLEQGLATPEHAAFVKRLAAAREAGQKS